MAKVEGEFDQFEYIWDSCLHFYKNLNEILLINIICGFLKEKSKNLKKNIFLTLFLIFPCFLKLFTRSLIQIPARCFKPDSQASHY